MILQDASIFEGIAVVFYMIVKYGKRQQYPLIYFSKNLESCYKLLFFEDKSSSVLPLQRQRYVLPIHSCIV